MPWQVAPQVPLPPSLRQPRMAASCPASRDTSSPAEGRRSGAAAQQARARSLGAAHGSVQRERTAAGWGGGAYRVAPGSGATPVLGLHIMVVWGRGIRAGDVDQARSSGRRRGRCLRGPAWGGGVLGCSGGARAPLTACMAAAVNALGALRNI